MSDTIQVTTRMIYGILMGVGRQENSIGAFDASEVLFRVAAKYAETIEDRKEAWRLCREAEERVLKIERALRQDKEKRDYEAFLYMVKVREDHFKEKIAVLEARLVEVDDA